MSHASLVVTSAAASEPVTTAEAKAHMRIDHTDEDTLIGSYIAAATRWCETFCRRRFINTTLRYSLDRFPTMQCDGTNAILLCARVQSISSVAYTDTAGATQTLTSSDYQLDSDSEPGRLFPAYGSVWPTARDNTPAAVRVTFVAGYGTTAASVGDDVKTAIKQIVAHWHEHRESVLTGTISKEIEQAATALLWPHRVYEFA